MSTARPIQRALLSVYDKTGVVEFAKGLSELGIALLSTGGTYRLLKEHNIPVTEVSDYTGFPEMMDGRVKTLHPKIHGGILARRGQDDAVMAEHGIDAIDLVVVNLYPFAETIAKPGCTAAEAIEQIDIGGPTMVRAAAKNHESVGIVVNSDDYDSIMEELKANQCGLSKRTKLALAAKAFRHTASYDTAVNAYLGQLVDDAEVFPEELTLAFSKQQDMRYGENPHQRAAFYIEANSKEPCVSTATQHQGKQLSFNNVADTDAALECVKSFKRPACVIVKHANPCGVAQGDDIHHAYQRAFATDPTSAFGGIIAFNQTLDAKTAEAIIEKQFVEVIIAPEITTEALQIISQKPNVRALSAGHWLKRHASFEYKRVSGGLLVQDTDLGKVTAADLNIVTEKTPTETQLNDLLFAWTVAKYVKSNAIVYAKGAQTIGIGAGQMSRVYSAKIAGIKASDENLQVKGSVMASDAFFPFRDGIDAAAKAGIVAVIQPGGSMRDEEVISAANEHGIAMAFTGMRHFKH